MSEKLLLKKVQNGRDAEAFEQLFRLYYDRLLRFIWGYVKSEAVAEELVQELFTKIWEKNGTLHIHNSVRTYLYSSARNMSIDYLRHQEVVRDWEDEKKALHMDNPLSTKIDRNLHNKMLLKEVERAIRSLPEKRRLVFILSRYEDMTYKEIAEFLDISVNTVETQISRVLNVLRQQFSHLLTFMLFIFSVAG